ncbi:MAG: beta-ketoacyl-ACP synthase II [Rhodocyclaceae bacterium]
MSKKRVVITGLGAISPIGNTVEETWQNALKGVSGIDLITKFDTTNFSVKFAAEVKNFKVADYIPAKDARRMDVFIHYGMAASIQAIRDAGLENNENINKQRVGVAVGSGIGGLPNIENTQTEYLKTGTKRISPFFIPGTIINMISGNISVMYGYQGPNLAIVTACSTGTHSIGEAARLIQYGDADIMIAGGSEAVVCPLAIGGFAAARALSTRNDDPKTSSRPFDKDRDGFVLGEGAGVLVLEEYEHAKARGAKIYAEIAGFGMTADAHHMTAPLEDGSGAARCMSLALQNADLSPNDVDYINAHGTSTPLGDVAETTAIKAAFGATAKNLVVNSTKSMTGHLLGAAGGIEAVFTALAIKNQISPPTINIFNQDERCDLDYCANQARQMEIRAALSNSFGFGGTNGTLAFKRV